MIITRRKKEREAKRRVKQLNITSTSTLTRNLVDQITEQPRDQVTALKTTRSSLLPIISPKTWHEKRYLCLSEP